MVGFATGDGPLVSAVSGIGTPAVAVLLWGMFAAPRAKYKVGVPVVLVVKALVLGGGALALYGVGHAGLAIGMGVVVVVNTTVVEVCRRLRPEWAIPAGPGAGNPVAGR
ncbi:YrdB family protein [Streptomyces triticagri]|uniref:YrdB family protein n=1 Tax=Streptomyces triticagri TaxID=2293568 RepID=UPI001F33A3FA|nr:YrdB family protein [Streptomyces triticagri]